MKMLLLSGDCLMTSEIRCENLDACRYTITTN
jgi:hypothetical protein